MAQRPITTVTHFSTHGLREVVGRAVHDQREYSAYERLVSAGPKRAPSTLGNHEIPVRHACVADCALAAQSRLRTSRHPTARPRPSSRWSAFLRCFTLEKQRRPALRCPARGAVALRPSSGQRANGSALSQRSSYRLSRLAAQTARQTTVAVGRVPLWVSRLGPARRRSQGAVLRGSGSRRRVVAPSQRRGRQREGRAAAARGCRTR